MSSNNITLLQLSLTSAPDRPVVNLLQFCRQGHGGHLLTNKWTSPSSLCKHHEPVHFTVEGEDKMTVAVQAGLVVRLLCAYCRLSKFVLSIYYEKQRLPLAKSLGLRHMTYSKSTSLFELPQKLRPQDADRFEKRRPFLKNCVLSPKNGVSANADMT